MKVNMTPNPLDVVTIHASQGDTEARQWEFELHNNGELIDTSDVKEQLVFKAYKGGTEQLLPENTSTPTTSPFLGDIKYPDATRNNQEFLYRQSPAEEDGLAKITSIKGNTIVWNQLAKELNATNWLAESTTASYSNGICTLTPSGYNGRISADADIIANHKYLMLGDFTNVDNQPVYFYIGAIGSYSTGIRIQQTSVLTRQSKIYTATETGKIYVRNNSNTGVVTIKNLMLIDLTQMGLDITDPSDITSLFPLSYYSYNQGSLLSFNGNGIKTVGKNLFNSADVITGKYVNDTNGVFRDQSNSVATNYIEIIPNTAYKIISAQITGMWGAWYDENKTFISGFISYATAKTSPSNAKYVAFTISYDGKNQDYANNVMLLFNGEDETFEPYTSSTLSLPISTYFPTGMKSAGNVYDELTESKAVTRIGAVDLGTLTYTLSATAGGGSRFSVGGGQMPNVKPSADNSTIMNAIFLYGKGVSQSNTYNNVQGASVSSTGVLNIYIEDYKNYTVDQFKTAMDGVYLYYELATPTETSFTTASLVTENAEIPLSNEDGVLIGKCTEQLSAEPGFHDAKIKLADAYGTCYSNKIQLHVERSPQ